MSAMQEMTKAMKSIEKALAKANLIAKDALADGAAELFAANPGLEAFGWRQYTPYFNDGDACEFSVHRDDMYDLDIWFDGYTLNGDNCDDEREIHPELKDAGYAWDSPTRYNWGTRSHEPNPEFNERLGAVVENVKAFANAFPEDTLRQLLGDHVEVRFTKTDSGVETTVEAYDHD